MVYGSGVVTVTAEAATNHVILVCLVYRPYDCPPKCIIRVPKYCFRYNIEKMFVRKRCLCPLRLSKFHTLLVYFLKMVEYNM